jgi:hypothetical protein
MTPYSELSDSDLLEAMAMAEDEMRQNGEHLDWAREHDTDSGLIDALDGDMRHAVADYNWMLAEKQLRGL